MSLGSLQLDIGASSLEPKACTRMLALDLGGPRVRDARFRGGVQALRIQDFYIRRDLCPSARSCNPQGVHTLAGAVFKRSHEGITVVAGAGRLVPARL